jgi:hypothetical protein
MPTKTRKKPASSSRAKRGDLDTGDDGEPTPDAIREAVENLGINRPFYTCRLVGNRLEFSLYGGDLVYWPPKPTRKQ